MPSKEECLRFTQSFRIRFGLEASDENLIAAIHLVNAHDLNPEQAIVQSSQGANDHGIDAWSYFKSQQMLSIYQSKLSDNRTTVLRGLKDLLRATQWLSQVMIDGKVNDVPSANTCLYNFYMLLSRVRGQLKCIELVLLSSLNDNHLEDSSECSEFMEELSRSSLKAFMSEKLQGKLIFRFAEFNLDRTIPPPPPVYHIPVIPETRLSIRKGTHLDLAYVPLYNLVELYRQRGNILFDKNVRLSLAKTREAKDRLVNPMTATLDSICNGQTNPHLFAFYHVGITMMASRSTDDDSQGLNLESPSIINGCQSITIAAAYLDSLEKKKDFAGIERFKQIKVVAKVVIGVSQDETKEITNANNRQNPIENWQLYSNEPIHMEIETLLREAGIFYERQKGKYETLKDCDTAQHYPNTNGTFLKVLDLAQIIALTKGRLDLAGKPSAIFLNKAEHEAIFNKAALINASDLIFLTNAFKALKRGLANYLERPVQVNSNASSVFSKTPVRMHTYRLALMYLYRSGNKRIDRMSYSTKLFKIAHRDLVDEAEIFYQKVVTKIRNWYAETSKDLQHDVSIKKLDAYFQVLAVETGLDSAVDQLPFAA